MRTQLPVGTVGEVDEALPLPLTQRLKPRHWVAIDVALAAFFAAGLVGGTAIEHHHVGPGGTGWDVVRYAAIAAACLPLPFRRRRSGRVLAVISAAAVVLVALGARGPNMAALVLAVYSFTAASPRRRSLTAAAGVIAAVLLGALVADGGPGWGNMISAPPLILVGWLAGENTRTRRAYIQDVAERAAERERQREDRSRRAAADERLRIARELHDVVAHAMSVVAVRSGVARMVIDSQPDEAREALAIIETTSRRALQEMRLLVGVLRQGEDAEAELVPAPGLADLPELLTQIGQAGVPVKLHVDGERRLLPPGVDLSAYRIVQEALTNVVRHVGPARANLSIRYRPDELEIEVADDGGRRYPSSAPLLAEPGQGHGLVGMRERVALFGGQLTAGPSNGGFLVVAHFPTDEARR
jgi:signal transduction histidine kinase